MRLTTCFPRVPDDAPGLLKTRWLAADAEGPVEVGEGSPGQGEAANGLRSIGVVNPPNPLGRLLCGSEASPRTSGELCQ